MSNMIPVVYPQPTSCPLDYPILVGRDPSAYEVARSPRIDSESSDEATVWDRRSIEQSS